MSINMIIILILISLFTLYRACIYSVNKRKKKYRGYESGFVVYDILGVIAELVYHTAIVNKLPKIILQHEYG